MLSIYSDEYFMRQALKEAEKAYQQQEIPVGAVVCYGNQIIARGANRTEKLKDVTAHAEIIALTAASNYLDSKYLPECTLFVTLEPCVMCAGALQWAQVGKVVYGASDPKRGFMRFGKELLHPKTILKAGVLELECSNLLSEFFQNKRSIR